MPRSKTASSKPKKSDFIRANLSLPVRAIVAKAKAAGISLSPGLVYLVKSAGAAKQASASAQPKGAKPAKVTSKKRIGRPSASKPVAVVAKTTPPAKSALTASAFIRSQPVTAPAKVVVAAGAKVGLKFSGNLVYLVRSKLKAKAAKAAKATARKPTAVGKPVPVLAATVTDDIVGIVVADVLATLRRMFDEALKPLEAAVRGG